MRRVLREPDAAVSWKIGTQIAALKEHVDDHPVSTDMATALHELRD